MSTTEGDSPGHAVAPSYAVSARRNSHPVVSFFVKVTASHVVTYLIVGAVAATVFDYERLFSEPLIRDYMRPFGSVAVYVGPLLQVARGLVIAAVLLPFRTVLRGKRGWLWLWLLLVGAGIISTSAAAPGSVEGAVYTRLPLWYHLIGLPEMLVQTLVFSILTALIARYPDGVLAALPPTFDRLVRALVSASLAFAGYAVVSVVFAMTSGIPLDFGSNFTWTVQGVFIAPFVTNGAIAYLTAGGVSPRRRAAGAATSYVLGVVAILAYQMVVSGGPNAVYALAAPVLPALLLWLLMPRSQSGALSNQTHAALVAAQASRRQGRVSGAR